MLILGLTGGSGAGKGYVSECFKKYGIQSIDTDKVSRSVCGAGKPCLCELVSEFGAEILTPEGELNRKKLASMVFGNEDKLHILNDITHKYILAECRSWLSVRESAGDNAAIVDAPLLFESGFDAYCDLIISVIADEDIRLKRITERDGITEESALKRIKSQHDNKFFIENSDFAVYNNNGESEVRQQADKIYRELLRQYPQNGG